MALIQMRRGKEADFDPTKMLPGEWAVSLDSKYVRMCFAPGDTRKMATYEAFEEDVKEVTILVEEAKEAATGIMEQVDSAKAYSQAANSSKLAAKQSAADSLASANRSQEQAQLAQNSVSTIEGAVSQIQSLTKEVKAESKKVSDTAIQVSENVKQIDTKVLQAENAKTISIQKAEESTLAAGQCEAAKVITNENLVSCNQAAEQSYSSAKESENWARQAQEIAGLSKMTAEEMDAILI